MIEKTIIGKPQEFAIEYSVVKFLGYIPYGGCRLWLEGNFLGDMEDFTLITSIEAYISPIVEKKYAFYLNNSFALLSELDLFEQMKSGKIGGHHYLPIEGFDAFYNYVYYRNNFFYFLWMLDSDMKDWEKYKNFPTDFFTAKVSIHTYEHVVFQFRKHLEKMCPQIYF